MHTLYQFPEEPNTNENHNQSKDYSLYLIVWAKITGNTNSQFDKIKNQRKDSILSCSSIPQIDTTYETKREDDVKNAIVHKSKRTIFSPERNHRRNISEGVQGKNLNEPF